MIELLSIEAHNERTKEEYASNPDIDKSRSHLNFHLIEPERKYRAEAERQDQGCGVQPLCECDGKTDAEIRQSGIGAAGERWPRFLYLNKPLREKAA